MDDATTTVKQLKDAIAQFADERDWNQFHSPKNLSMSIAIELADVVCYCLALANSMNIDLSESFEHKMARNREKYPAEEFKGIYGHDDPARGA